MLTASVPSGPSPVLSVPRAIADIVEGRELVLSAQGGNRDKEGYWLCGARRLGIRLPTCREWGTEGWHEIQPGV